MSDELTNENTGQALDASVVASTAVSTEDDITFARNVVAATQAKVDKQKEHLAGAEQSLANAKAALAALEGV